MQLSCMRSPWKSDPVEKDFFFFGGGYLPEWLIFMGFHVGK